MGYPDLEIADDRSKLTRGKKARTERTGPVLTNGRKGSQSGSDFRRHLRELPPDLVGGCFRLIRRRQAHRLHVIRSRAECVGAHVGDG